MYTSLQNAFVSTMHYIQKEVGQSMKPLYRSMNAAVSPFFAEGFNDPLKEGKLSGFATVRYSNGDVARGLFADDKLNGQGKIVLDNGGVMEGTFKNGELNGMGRITKGQEIEEGLFTNGRLVTPQKVVLPALVPSLLNQAAAPLHPLQKREIVPVEVKEETSGLGKVTWSYF